MAIKINGNTVIDDSLNGKLQGLTIGGKTIEELIGTQSRNAMKNAQSTVSTKVSDYGLGVDDYYTAYSVHDPSFVADFKNNYYRTGKQDSTFENMFDFASASLRTITASDGHLKTALHNKAQQSADLTLWNQIRVSTALLTETDPFGLPVFLVVEDTTATNTHGIQKQGTANPNNVLEFHAKSGGRDYIRVIYTNSGADGATFTLTGDGSVTIHNATEITEATITPISDGWYHCRMISNTADDVHFYNATDGTGTYSYTGDGVSGFKISAVRIFDESAFGLNMDVNVNYAGTLAETYYPNLTTNVQSAPRVNHHRYNGDSFENVGLLYEADTTTNKLLYSNDFSNAAWLQSGTPTVTQDKTGPDGIANSAWTITDDSTGGYEYLYQSITITNAEIGIIGSIFIEHDDTIDGTTNAQFPHFRLALTGGTTTKTASIFFDPRNGSYYQETADVHQVFVERYSANWWRVSIVVVNNTTGNTTCTMSIWPGAGSSAGGIGGGTGSCGVYQADLVEDYGTWIPTSPIVTYGSTVTRTLETLTAPTSSIRPSIVDEKTTVDRMDKIDDWTPLFSTLSIEDGELKITQTGVAGYAQKIIPVTPGVDLDMSVYCYRAGGANRTSLWVYDWDTTTGTSVGTLGSALTTGAETISITDMRPTQDAVRVWLKVEGAAGQLGYFDDFTVTRKWVNDVSISMKGRAGLTDFDHLMNVFYLSNPNNTERLKVAFQSDPALTDIRLYVEAYSNATTYLALENGWFTGGFIDYDFALYCNRTGINWAESGVEHPDSEQTSVVPKLSTAELYIHNNGVSGQTRYVGTIEEIKIFNSDITLNGLLEETD